MGRMYIENNSVVYSDEERTEILLSYEDIITNYSRFPLQYMGEGENSLFSLVLNSLKTHGALAAQTQESFADREYATVEILLAKEHMKTPYELRALEIGCDSGIMSYHLAKLMGKYNKESQLCCVTDTIGNESGNGWLDKIALLECMPKVSFVATDYDCLPLPDAYFDVVVLNGSISFQQKEAVISEAARVLKKNGLLISYIVRDVELIEQLADKCKELKVYSYLEDRCLLCAEAENIVVSNGQNGEVSCRYNELLELSREKLENETSPEELRNVIRKLDTAVCEAGESGNLDVKVLLMMYKGEVLDKLVRMKYGKADNR